MKTVIICNVYLALSFLSVFSQGLSLDKALEEALKHNHGIQQSRIQNEMAKNRIHKGVAGYLPRVDFTANAGYSNNLTNTEFGGNIPDVVNQIANGNNQATSLAAYYTLFNGKGKVYAYQKLKTQGANADILLRLQMENTIYQVVLKYYEAYQLQEAVTINVENIRISKNRLKRAENKAEFGQGSSLLTLSSRVDLSKDSLTYIQTRQGLEQSLRDLHFLMGSKEMVLPKLTTAPSIKGRLILEDLLSTGINNNSEVMALEKGFDISELNFKLSKASTLPKIDLNLSYGYNRSQNDASIVLQQQNLGLNTGLSLNYNIYNGRQKKIELENLSLQRKIEGIKVEEGSQRVRKDIMNAWSIMLTAKRLLKMEEENVILSQKNLEFLTERNKAGRSSDLEVREAQQNVFFSKNRILQQKIQLGKAELDLYLLTGKLLEEVKF